MVPSDLDAELTAMKYPRHGHVSEALLLWCIMFSGPIKIGLCGTFLFRTGRSY